MDIAKFWNQTEVDAILKPQQQETALGSEFLGKEENFFAQTFLDRATHKRKESEWIKKALKEPHTKFVVFRNLDALVVPHGGQTSQKQYSLLLTEYATVQKVVPDVEKTILIFLGIEIQQETCPQQSAWFAVEVGHLDEDQTRQISANAEWLQPLPGSLQLAPRDAAVYAQARTVLAWHDRHGFCPTCGKESRVAEAGYKRACIDPECRSQKGIV